MLDHSQLSFVFFHTCRHTTRTQTHTQTPTRIPARSHTAAFASQQTQVRHLFFGCSPVLQCFRPRLSPPRPLYTLPSSLSLIPPPPFPLMPKVRLLFLPRSRHPDCPDCPDWTCSPPPSPPLPSSAPPRLQPEAKWLLGVFCYLWPQASTLSPSPSGPPIPPPIRTWV